MEIQNLYSNRTTVITYLNVRTVKMYGALVNYLGYVADVGYTNGCCVPQFIFNTLHNTNDKHPIRIISKLIMQNVIDDLGMQTEDEGCCLAESANLCQTRNVIHYALDFKHALFETNQDTAPTNHLPR